MYFISRERRKDAEKRANACKPEFQASILEVRRFGVSPALVNLFAGQAEIGYSADKVERKQGLPRRLQSAPGQVPRGVRGSVEWAGEQLFPFVAPKCVRFCVS